MPTITKKQVAKNRYRQEIGILGEYRNATIPNRNGIVNLTKGKELQ